MSAPSPGRRLLRAARADDGMTMMDLLVSMTVMGVVAAMLTAGIVQLNRMVRKAEANSVAQSQVSTTLVRLDRQVRYATRINVAAGGATVTYEVVETGGNRCYQTRLSAGSIQQRSKPVNGAYGDWGTLATGVTGGSFTLVPAADGQDHQRLTVDVTARSPGGSAATKQSVVTFTALNTTGESPTTAC